jgi:2-dehydro-3-deoxygalactonokinase
MKASFGPAPQAALAEAVIARASLAVAVVGGLDSVSTARASPDMPAMTPASHLVAIDWGTTSLRAGLMDASGAILDRLNSADGIMAMQGRSYPDIVEALFGPWLARAPDAVVLASGMVGSRQGWIEAPYVPCPADFAAIAGGIVWQALSAGRRIGFVPGLSTGAATTTPDVMRGEEVQVFGALGLSGGKDGVFVLPGTHSKWVAVAGERVIGFHTMMTGEVFGVLRRHTILGRLMPADSEPAFDEAVFGEGCRLSLDDAGGAILNRLFSARTRGLFDQLGPDALPSYLSGLLIGEEVREARALLGGALPPHVHLICREDLARAYRHCLALADVTTTVIEDAAFLGLHEIARRNALID